MTKTFRIKVLVDNEETLIRPGMISRVSLLKREVNDALVAPLFSLVDKGGERMLYVVKDEVVHARVVKTGILDGDKVQIRQRPGSR